MLPYDLRDYINEEGYRSQTMFYTITVHVKRLWLTVILNTVLSSERPEALWHSNRKRLVRRQKANVTRSI